MKNTSTFTRRQWLGTTAATAGGQLLPGSMKSPAALTGIGETEHFWYRLGPEDLYIDSQRDHKAIAFGKGKVHLSEDNGRTWPHSVDVAGAEHLLWSCLLKNGNILFATRTELFLSTDNLKSFRPVIVKARDGSDYLPHKPVNPEEPGWYFHTVDGEHTFDVNGSEMLIWGNYCNVVGGPTPLSIY